MAVPDLTIQTTEVNDDFVTAYIEAALWSSNDESDESGGEPLDSNYSAEDLDPKAREEMVEDCRKFLAEFGHLITEENCPKGKVFEQAGHDFWLNRNGHGCGFWDGDWEEPAATILSDACEKFGNTGLYVGDDGKIHCE